MFVSTGIAVGFIYIQVRYLEGSLSKVPLYCKPRCARSPRSPSASYASGHAFTAKVEGLFLPQFHV